MELKQMPRALKGVLYAGDLENTYCMLGKPTGRTDDLHIATKLFRAPVNQWSTRYDKMRGYTFDSKLLCKGTREECIEAIRLELETK